jgi:hypothetical protein
MPFPKVFAKPSELGLIMEELTKKSPGNSDDNENLKGGQATSSNKQGQAGSDEEVADSSSNA